jgi:pyruvate kinase
MPRTKIIATLGPASANYTVLRKMFVAGLDVVRLNFSHGTHAQHAEAVALVRKLNGKYRRHIRIMQDLEGFRIRIGRFKGPKTRELKDHSTIWLTNDEDAAGAKAIPFDYQGDLTRIKKGQMVFIDDGNLSLRVKESSRTSLKAVVVEGGVLKERKGINMPGAPIDFDAMTEKDKTDVKFGIHHKVDYVALSFVRSADDVMEAARLLKPHLP